MIIINNQIATNISTLLKYNKDLWRCIEQVHSKKKKEEEERTFGDQKRENAETCVDGTVIVDKTSQFKNVIVVRYS